MLLINICRYGSYLLFTFAAVSMTNYKFKHMSGSTMQFFWIALCLFITFVSTGFAHGNASDSSSLLTLSQELQNQHQLSNFEPSDFAYRTFLAIQESDENPLEVLEVIEFDDDENRKKCVLPLDHSNSKERVLFCIQGSASLKESNPLYILYCSLRIHLV
jgi:hypothetical protein